MRLRAPVTFMLAVLGSALGALLALGAPLVFAEAAPLSGFSRPLTGSLDTASIIAVTIAGFVAVVGVIVYSSLVLKRESQSPAATGNVFDIAPKVGESEQSRKAA